VHQEVTVEEIRQHHSRKERGCAVSARRPVVRLQLSIIETELHRDYGWKRRASKQCCLLDDDSVQNGADVDLPIHKFSAGAVYDDQRRRQSQLPSCHKEFAFQPPFIKRDLVKWIVLRGAFPNKFIYAYLDLT